MHAPDYDDDDDVVTVETRKPCLKHSSSLAVAPLIAIIIASASYIFNSTIYFVFFYRTDSMCEGTTQTNSTGVVQYSSSVGNLDWHWTMENSPVFGLWFSVAL